MTEEEFRNKVTSLVAEGGWSSISHLVDSIPIEDLKDLYPSLNDEEDENNSN